MLTLNDGRAELWQWDTRRTLAVDADCSQVHFSNKVFGRSIDVDVVDGVAIIPDILLQTDNDLNVWAFVGTAENGYTKISKTFKVNRRNKPADYVFTPPEQTTLAELVEQIGNLDELTTKAKDNLVAAINEAAKTGSGEGGSTDHTKLTNRNADDQHPMSAITGLVKALDGKMDRNNPVGIGSFSMGRKSGTAVGYNSHAEGSYTTASGAVSHAEGYETTASGNESHAEGYSSKAFGAYSHAEGYETEASGESSHAEGISTVVMGSYSHAEGYGTAAYGNGSHVQGKYNIYDNDGKYAHTVGNGVSHYERSNAHTLDWSGNAWYAGDVFVGSASGTNKDDGSKKLATEEYVNNEIADCIKAPASAKVGQTVVVKAVDETGKPTEWEAADMESGGGGASYRSWSKAWTLAIAEDIAGFTASGIDLDGKSEIMIVFISDSTSSRTMANGRLLINGVDVGKVLFNSLQLKKDSHSFVIIGRADVGIEYTTMQATAEYQTYPWQGEVKIVHRMVIGTGSIIQWTAGSTIEITQASATLGQGITIEIYVR